MNRSLVMLAVLGLVACRSVSAAETEAASGRLIPPPSIYIPHGGTIVTEINVSDDDVLGIIKQIVPAAAEVARGVVAEMAKGGVSAKAGIGIGVPLAFATQLDVEGLMAAVGGIERIRVIIARYDREIDAKTFMAEFDSGVAKAGTFSKVLGDTGFIPGAAGIYAAPGNASYIGFAYVPREHALYAARIVGFVDVPGLTRWIGNAVKMFAGVAQGTEVREEAPSAPDAQVIPGGEPKVDEPPPPDQQ